MPKNAKCPFCGGDTLVIEQEYLVYNGYFPSCSNNKCIMYNPKVDGEFGYVYVSYPTEQEAIDAWNNRPFESTLRERAKKAEDELRHCIDYLESALSWINDEFGGAKSYEHSFDDIKDALAKAKEVLNEQSPE
jgi:hypothetical protein